MKITWYGHAAFLIEGEGVRIIMDPYSRECGYDPIDEPADIVTLSHENAKYHSCLSDVKGSPEVVRGLEILDGGRKVRGVQFESVLVNENDDREVPVAMIHFEVDGIRLCHMGDLGHALSEEELSDLRGTEVLLALAGGRPTMLVEDLITAIERLRPAVIIPMHYLTPKIDLKIGPVDDFLRLLSGDQIRRVSASHVELSKGTLPSEPMVYVLQHAR